MEEKQKSLRKLSRSELIDIIYELKAQEALLERENEELKKKLENRTIMLKNSGSIADAAIQINRLLETAQQTANDYLDSIEQLKVRTEKEQELIIDVTNKKALEYLKKIKNSVNEE